MTQGTRTGGGAWIYLALAVVAVAVFAVVSAASSPAPAAAPASSVAVTPSDEPIVPAVTPIGGTRLAPRTVRARSSHCDRSRCCPTRVRAFGTPADITTVIGAFQARGFRYAAPPLVAPVSGDPRTSGRYLRWLGERPGDVASWRQVNVATGTIAGRPAWSTVFEVARPRCPGDHRPLRPPEDWPRNRGRGA